jgi:hypothetical protein
MDLFLGTVHALSITTHATSNLYSLQYLLKIWVQLQKYTIISYNSLIANRETIVNVCIERSGLATGP